MERFLVRKVRLGRKSVGLAWQLDITEVINKYAHLELLYNQIKTDFTLKLLIVDDEIKKMTDFLNPERIYASIQIHIAKEATSSVNNPL